MKETSVKRFIALGYLWIIILICLYILFSFYAGSYYPNLWSQDGRTLFTGINGFVLGVFFIIGLLGWSFD